MKRSVIICLVSIFSLADFSLAAVTRNTLEQPKLDDKGIHGIEQENEQHEKSSPEHVYRFEGQTVTVEDFDASGYILAIGGGGEGIIGRLKGRQVIAVDISRRELEGTPPGPLKIVMDARDLKFLDDTFNTAASFFTLCYIDGADHEKVFAEIFRVLAPGGRFLIWDVSFLKRVDEKKDVALVPLLVKLPDKEITTGYGVHWPERVHDLPYYVQLAEKSGFEVAAGREKDRLFYLELIKPQ